MVFRSLATLLLGALFVGACASSSQEGEGDRDSSRAETEHNQEALYREEARQRFGTLDDVRFFSNEARTYMLIVEEPKPTSEAPIQRSRYFVYDTEEQAIALEEEQVRGRVRWEDDAHLRVHVTPGMESTRPEDNTYTYLVDVRTGKRLKADRPRVDQ